MDAKSKELFMSMLRFDLAFPDQDTCWRLLERVRWPNGPVCDNSRCGSVGDAAPWRPRPHHWQCSRCGRQFNARLKTPLAGSHLPLRTWFQAIHFLHAQPYLSSPRLGRLIEVGQKTALSVKRRVSILREKNPDLVDAVIDAVTPPPKPKRGGRIGGGRG